MVTVAPSVAKLLFAGLVICNKGCCEWTVVAHKSPNPMASAKITQRVLITPLKGTSELSQKLSEYPVKKAYRCKRKHKIGGELRK
jgi:hypothetical protein